MCLTYSPWLSGDILSWWRVVFNVTLRAVIVKWCYYTSWQASPSALHCSVSYQRVIRRIHAVYITELYIFFKPSLPCEICALLKLCLWCLTVVLSDASVTDQEAELFCL